MTQRRMLRRLFRSVAGVLALLVVAAGIVVGAAAPAQAVPTVPSALTFTAGVDPGAPTVLVEPGTTENSALYADTFPPGMELEFFGDGSGIRLAGTPTTAGVYNVRFDVTFPGGPWMQPYTTVVTVQSAPVTPAPVWSTTTLGTITRLDSVNVGLVASDATSFAVTSGSLPAGLTLVGSTISGTATAAVGSFSFTVTATGQGGSTAQVLSGLIAARAIAWPAPSVGPFTAGVPVNLQLSGTNVEAFSVTGGAMPAGITLTPGGLLSGTPTASGTFDVAITGGNSDGSSITRSLSIVVNPAPPATWAGPTEILLTTGDSIFLAYSDVVGGQFSGLSSPIGLVQVGLSGSGITVTGLRPGTGSITLFLASPYAGYTEVVIPIEVRNAAVWVTESLGALREGVAIDATLALEATDATGYALTAGALPAGLTLGADGSITGRPTAAGAYAFTVEATNGIAVVPREFTGRVNTPLVEWVTDALAQVAVDAPLGVALDARHAASFTIAGGMLPPGASLGSDGTLKGTPTAAGSFAFTVRAANADDEHVDRAFTLDVLAPPAWTGPTSILLTTGGSFAVGPDDVVDGDFDALTLVSGGELLEPDADDARKLLSVAPGTAVVQVRMTNAVGVVRTADVTIEIRNAPVWVTESLGALREGVAADAALALEATDATGYALTAGALPAGLTLGADGSITGTPTAFGAYAFTVEATNGDVVVAREFTGDVNAPLVIWATTDLPMQHLNVAADLVFEAAHAVSFAVTDGALPDGLELAADGTISGAPTEAGSFDVEVTATNASGEAVARAFTVVVDEPVLSVVLDGEPGDAASGMGVIVTGSGLAPGAAFDVTMFSDPIVVEDGVVAADGTIDVAASLPDEVPFGAHELRVTAVGADGEAFTTSVWFSVGEDGEIVEISTVGPVAEPERRPAPAPAPSPSPEPSPAAVTATGMAATGVEPSIWLAGSTLLLALGAALQVMRRRRAELARR